jgi:hypothetical protein
MQVKSIIQEIQELSLDERFLIIEQTLQSIKKEELKHSTVSEPEAIYKSTPGNKKFDDVFINEKSLAPDWLSEEDSRWDNLL